MGEFANTESMNNEEPLYLSLHDAGRASPETAGFHKASTGCRPKAGVQGETPKTSRVPPVVWLGTSDDR